jgi:Leucine Rich repeat
MRFLLMSRRQRATQRPSQPTKAASLSTSSSRPVCRYILEATELNLWNKATEHAKQLAQELSVNTSLTYLNLGRNSIGKVGVVALARTNP